MLSALIKEERKSDALKSGIFPPPPDLETASTTNQEETMTLYTCANCTRVVALSASSQLMCTHCVHRTGSSTVFYKLRTQPTTYDTI